jgi:hypothetical protein
MPWLARLDYINKQLESAYGVLSDDDWRQLVRLVVDIPDGFALDTRREMCRSVVCDRLAALGMGNPRRRPRFAHVPERDIRFVYEGDVRLVYEGAGARIIDFVSGRLIDEHLRLLMRNALLNSVPGRYRVPYEQSHASDSMLKAITRALGIRVPLSASDCRRELRVYYQSRGWRMNEEPVIDNEEVVGIILGSMPDLFEFSERPVAQNNALEKVEVFEVPELLDAGDRVKELVGQLRAALEGRRGEQGEWRERMREVMVEMSQLLTERPREVAVETVETRLLEMLEALEAGQVQPGELAIARERDVEERLPFVELAEALGLVKEGDEACCVCYGHDSLIPTRCCQGLICARCFPQVRNQRCPLCRKPFDEQSNDYHQEMRRERRSIIARRFAEVAHAVAPEADVSHLAAAIMEGDLSKVIFDYLELARFHNDALKEQCRRRAMRYTYSRYAEWVFEEVLCYPELMEQPERLYEVAQLLAEADAI